MSLGLILLIVLIVLLVGASLDSATHGEIVMALLWPFLFVLGVVLKGVAENDGPPELRKVAWVLWMIAALIWYAVTFGESNISLFQGSR